MSLVGFKARNHPQQVAKPQVDDRATAPEVFAPLHARFHFTMRKAAVNLEIEFNELERQEKIQKKFTDWIVDTDGQSAYRAWAADKDHTNPLNRVAFIEKTPRIRIRAPQTDGRGTDPDRLDYLNWASGPKGSNGFDKESRAWCDKMLEIFYGWRSL